MRVRGFYHDSYFYCCNDEANTGAAEQLLQRILVIYFAPKHVTHLSTLYHHSRAAAEAARESR